MKSDKKYFLALMLLPGDCAFINIADLDIANGFSPIDLAGIDSFTMKYSKREIMESIKRMNLVSEKYLNGSLVIASEVDSHVDRHTLDVIDRELYNDFNVINFLNSILDSKELLNTVINKFESTVKNNELSALYKEALKNGDVIGANNLIFSPGLSYVTQRAYLLYLLKLRDKKLENDNIKVLERSNKE